MQRIFLAILMIAMMGATGLAQQLTPPTFRGWQFIPWGMDKVYCERLLEESGIKTDPGHPNAKVPTTRFVFEGWNTRFGYDGWRLYDVQQEIEFPKGEGDSAIEKFQTIQKEMVKLYGAPKSLSTDESGMRLIVIFETKYNEATLSIWNHPGWPPAVTLHTTEL